MPRLTLLRGRLKLTPELPADRLSLPAEEKRIYRLPVFTAPFCQALLEELEHFERSDMPKGRPNTMNNYGVSEAPPGGLEAGTPGSQETDRSAADNLCSPLCALVSPSVK